MSMVLVQGDQAQGQSTRSFAQSQRRKPLLAWGSRPDHPLSGWFSEDSIVGRASADGRFKKDDPSPTITTRQEGYRGHATLSLSWFKPMEDARSSLGHRKADSRSTFLRDRHQLLIAL